MSCLSDRPPDGHPHVVVRPGEPLHPVRLVGTEQAHTRPLGQVDEVAGVAVVHGVGLGFGLGLGLGVGEEALPAELPQRLQEPVQVVPAGVGDNHRLVDEGHAGRARARGRRASAQIASAPRQVNAGEHRQPGEQRRSPSGAAGTTSRSRGEGLVARGPSGVPADTAGRIVEPLGQLGGVHHADRAAASSIPSGMPSSRSQISATGRPPSAGRPVALGTARSANRPQASSAGSEGTGPHPLPRHAQGLPAGGQHGDGRARAR